MKNINFKIFHLALAIFVVFIVAFPFTEIPAADFYEYARTHLHQYGLEENIKCGFPVVLLAQASEEKFLKEQLQIQMDANLLLDSVYVSPSGHFKISYSTTGINAIPDYDRNQDGFPDYLEFIANSFDHAWATEIDTLGFLPPPDSSGNYRNVYPIFCKRLSLYGSTNLIYMLPQTENGIKYVTNIDISTDFSFANYPKAKDDIARDSMAIAVTAAHEFNHALQSGYRLYPDNSGFFYDIWFIESSATYMEEVVCPEINDYLQYVSKFLNETDYPLDETGTASADYGKVTFEIMLGKLYGRDITRRIWQEIVSNRARQAVENVLVSLNSSLFTELTRLSGWFYFIGNRALGNQYFPDANLYQESWLKFNEGTPVQSSQTTLISDALPRLSFKWYQSEINTPQAIKIYLQAMEGSSAENLRGTFIEPGATDFTAVLPTQPFLIPVQNNQELFSYSVINGQNAGDEVLSFRVISRSDNEIADIYPQPMRLTADQPFLNFSNLPPGATIYIFTSNGKHLQTLRNSSEKTVYIWDLRTKYNKRLGSGIYIYKIEGGKDEKAGKFVVIN